MKFKYNKNAVLQAVSDSNNLEEDTDDSYKDHPIIKSIISNLGGREIK